MVVVVVCVGVCWGVLTSVVVVVLFREQRIKRKNGLRRVQRARRRDRKAHPAKVEDDGEDEDDMDATGIPRIKYSHHVLNLSR
jgi:heme exporter protein D